MQEEINQLKEELASQKRDFEAFKLQMSQQMHNGVDGHSIEFGSLIGTIRTITSSTELTNFLANKPTSVYNQLAIDTTTGTKKLYIYDIVGDVWRSTTIA